MPKAFLTQNKIKVFFFSIRLFIYKNYCVNFNGVFFCFITLWPLKIFLYKFILNGAQADPSSIRIFSISIKLTTPRGFYSTYLSILNPKGFFFERRNLIRLLNQPAHRKLYIYLWKKFFLF